MLNSFHYSNESMNVYIQLRIRFHLNRLSSCLTTIYGLNEIKSKWILTWKKIWARFTVLCFLYLSPKEKIIALNRYIPIFDRSYFNIPSLNQPDETKQQQQVENQPISRLFFRNDQMRQSAHRPEIKFGWRAFTSALTRVPPCDTRQMSTSRRHVGREKEDKKGKQDSVSSIVPLPPSSTSRYPCKSMADNRADNRRHGRGSNFATKYIDLSP